MVSSKGGGKKGRKINTKNNNNNNDKRKSNGRQQQEKQGRQQQQQDNMLQQQMIPHMKYSMMSSEEKCDLIAELSETILEDPTNAFQERETTKSNNDNNGRVNNEEGSIAAATASTRLPTKVQQLLDLGRVHKNGNDMYVASLAVMSLLAVFKDIIPSYRIRLPTQSERNANTTASNLLSKETKKLWDYERALVTHYQQYLQLLEKVWDNGQEGMKKKGRQQASSSSSSSSLPPNRLAITAMLCLCELLKNAYHFNFRSNILGLVVKQMNHKACDQVATNCCLAIEYIFQNDSQGEVSMEASRLIAKTIREYKGPIRPSVLQTFIKLPLRVHIDEAQAAKLITAANAKKRKRDRELAEIESELKESSGTVDKIVLARCQSETLQSIILTYFRILKGNANNGTRTNDNNKQSSSSREELLPIALEGLAKFAHLINIDTVKDLLDVLKDLLEQVDTLTLESSLNCILTAFQTLQGPGREMQIDVKEYITPLYSQLPRLVTETNCIQCTDIVLQCLNAAFIKRKEYSTIRIAAFTKQIITTALHTPDYVSISLIAMTRQILQRYPSVQQLLESEDDVITSGHYQPNVLDPEHSNPFSTSAWEFATLKFHIHPTVRNFADNGCKLKLLSMPGESPDRLFKEKSKEVLEELYIPFKRIQKIHPLSSGSNRRQLRFITPRKTECTLLLPMTEE